ncbi:hypothetical protein ACK2M7_14075 [Chryseobacterium sp. TY4]
MIASDLFLKKLGVYLSEKGYEFLNSKKMFKKKINDYEYIIKIKFDGRGGLTTIHWVECRILHKAVETNSISYWNEQMENGLLRFPTMYSQQALDYANHMNLKKLSQMNFDDKYPNHRIDNAVENFIIFFEQNVVPFFINNKALPLT